MFTGSTQHTDDEEDALSAPPNPTMDSSGPTDIPDKSKPKSKSGKKKGGGRRR